MDNTKTKDLFDVSFEEISKLTDLVSSNTTTVDDFEKIGRAFIDAGKRICKKAGIEVGTTHDLLSAKLLQFTDDGLFASTLMISEKAKAIKSDRSTLQTAKVLAEKSMDLIHITDQDHSKIDHSEAQILATELGALSIEFLMGYNETGNH